MRVLCDERAVAQATADVACIVEAWCHRQTAPVVMVAVLRGGVFFAVDLIRRISHPVTLEFASASSYGANTQRGALSFDMLPSQDAIQGRAVMVVDDIVDSGHTMVGLVRRLYDRDAAVVRTCALLNKTARREVIFQPDWYGLDVGDEFAIGGGLGNQDGLHRGLRSICVEDQGLSVEPTT